MKKVTSAEFDKKMRESLKIKPCRDCATVSSNIVVLKPAYGRNGVRVFCKYCGNSTTLKRDADCFADDSRLGTPVTAESLAKAIFEAVEEWNGENEKGG